jgi:hypothetical protein
MVGELLSLTRLSSAIQYGDHVKRLVLPRNQVLQTKGRLAVADRPLDYEGELSLA